MCWLSMLRTDFEAPTDFLCIILANTNVLVGWALPALLCFTQASHIRRYCATRSRAEAPLMCTGSLSVWICFGTFYSRQNCWFTNTFAEDQSWNRCHTSTNGLLFKHGALLHICLTSHHLCCFKGPVREPRFSVCTQKHLHWGMCCPLFVGGLK